MEGRKGGGGWEGDGRRVEGKRIKRVEGGGGGLRGRGRMGG
jgi:hypothetical protein